MTEPQQNQDSLSRTRRVRGKAREVVVYAALTAFVLSAAAITGCVHRSGGTWMFESAPLPEGWPELTPVGEVRVREYPVYRAAVVERTDVGAGQSPMFNELFGHIKRNDIAMTAPVEMEYDGSPEAEGDMRSMAFIYRSTELGEPGEAGAVRVRDMQARTFASVGVRGGYTAANYRQGLETLEAWLSESAEWRASGEPRYLGYNGPFVPWFWRYGEVQVPVSAATGE